MPRDDTSTGHGSRQPAAPPASYIYVTSGPALKSTNMRSRTAQSIGNQETCAPAEAAFRAVDPPQASPDRPSDRRRPSSEQQALFPSSSCAGAVCSCIPARCQGLLANLAGCDSAVAGASGGGTTMVLSADGLQAIERLLDRLAGAVRGSEEHRDAARALHAFICDPHSPPAPDDREAYEFALNVLLAKEPGTEAFHQAAWYLRWVAGMIRPVDVPDDARSVTPRADRVRPLGTLQNSLLRLGSVLGDDE